MKLSPIQKLVVGSVKEAGLESTLKQDVQSLDFASDVDRLCEDGGIVYQHHKWKGRICFHCKTTR